MKRDPLLWAALLAVLVVLASAEYQLAVACGFGQYVAAGVPAALDVYAIAALRARRDVLAVVVTLIAVNAASHLVSVGLLPVSVGLVVAVSAVAPLVLWRVHRLGEAHPEPEPEPTPEPSAVKAEPAPELPTEVTVERASVPVEAAPGGPVLGPWTPVAELAAGTSGTVADVLGPHYRDVKRVVTEPGAAPEPEPAAEPGTATELQPEPAAPPAPAADARVDEVRNWLKAEPELTGTEVGTRLGVSAGYGRRLLRAARGGDS